MGQEGNPAARIFRIGGRQYELVEVDGELPPVAGQVGPAQFDHDAGVLRVSRSVPAELRAWAVAVAVSDACFRLWRPVPVIWPNWLPADRPPATRRPASAAKAAGKPPPPARRAAAPVPQPGLAGGSPPS